ncbi:ras-related protein RABE1c-like [Iris pallida]|uniref:Ras-related protein RABE1c-like n=1 Tax=Iris pallida TaxID=29817 RepID=A0AAX6HDL2_IRIPA|nr:ras-related protein RABE1c-like [Iris pallida]
MEKIILFHLVDAMGASYSNVVYVLKLRHKSDMQSKMIERPLQDNISTLNPKVNASRDADPESEEIQDGKIREITMDNVDSEPLVAMALHLTDSDFVNLLN